MSVQVCVDVCVSSLKSGLRPSGGFRGSGFQPPQTVPEFENRQTPQRFDDSRKLNVFNKIGLYSKVTVAAINSAAHLFTCKCEILHCCLGPAGKSGVDGSGTPDWIWGPRCSSRERDRLHLSYVAAKFHVWKLAGRLQQSRLTGCRPVQEGG